MASIGLKSMENPLEFGIVITREDGSIERFLEKPTWGQVFSDTINTGIYVLELEGLVDVLREIAAELWSANDAGIPVEGVCLFPIIDRMDWNDENHWHNSGLWDLAKDENGFKRVLNTPYAEALRHSQALLARCGWGEPPQD